jgi:plasmid maintenance system antidote protein VapI
VVNGSAGVSAELAIRLAAFLGTSAESWLNMQAAYDLRKARKNPRPKIKRLTVEHKEEGAAKPEPVIRQDAAIRHRDERSRL